jgi:hypothetical protein
VSRCGSFAAEKLREDRRLAEGVTTTSTAGTSALWSTVSPPTREAEVADCTSGDGRLSRSSLSVACCFAASLIIAATRAASLLLLQAGAWAIAGALPLSGDLVEERRGAQPRWSIGKTRIGAFVPLGWLGLDHRWRMSLGTTGVVDRLAGQAGQPE